MVISVKPAAALVDGGIGAVGGEETLAGGGGAELGEEVLELIEEGAGDAEVRFHAGRGRWDGRVGRREGAKVRF